MPNNYLQPTHLQRAAEAGVECPLLADSGRSLSVRLRPKVDVHVEGVLYI